MDEIKVVVITGAGSGLGASLAKKYAAQGCHVCLLGRTTSKLTQVAETLGSEHSVYTVDVSSKMDVETVIESINEEVGPIDLLINNAGIGVFGLAETISEEAVHHMIDINLKGIIFCSQAVLPGMKERNYGYVVNVASTAGIEGKVNESVYCASKFGVKGFTESLALELKDTPIRVLAAYMGGMNTEFWDGIYTAEQTKHLMNPDDIADIMMANIHLRKNLSVDQVVIKNKF